MLSAPDGLHAGGMTQHAGWPACVILCGLPVPVLSCAACLCLYYPVRPACVMRMTQHAAQAAQDNTGHGMLCRPVRL
jgi:hypothetical protein